MSVSKVLAGLLGVQVLLAVFTWWPSGGPPPSRAVFPFELDAVTALRINSPGAEADGELRLEKREGAWVVASQFDYPADNAKVEEHLESLLALAVRQPISSNPIRHAQLDVSDAKHTRKVQITAGDETVEVFAGVADGSRLNLREIASPDVYQASGLGAWAIPQRASRFYERRVLEIDPETLEAMTLTNERGTLTLARNEDGDWSSPQLGEAEALDQAKVKTLLTTLFTVDMENPMDPSGRNPLQDPDITATWTLGGDTPSTHRYGAYLFDRKVALQTEDLGFPVMSASLRFGDALRDTDLAALLASTP